MECPDVVGRSPREARLMIESAGLRVPDSCISYDYSRIYPQGVVMAQSPPPQTRLTCDQPVRLTVSTGPEASVTAPDLVGMKLDRVYAVLAERNLYLGEVTRAANDSAASGTVLSQSPLPGTAMRTWSEIDLTVAAGTSADDSSSSDLHPMPASGAAR